ncbi:hypothetical protein VQ042_22125 [Aurantimonas sp. A2-1-M11]|uniref:hypothetical protein n=1 Tax=Aurantimonas sp. A2-1-M11 TaxID=3113712 RepID=UPI002F923DD3
MPFEMETSSTGNAAKLAVLWRDHQLEIGGGIPERLLRELLEGAWIEPIQGQPEPPLIDRPTVYTTAEYTKPEDLVSLFAAVQDLRDAIIKAGTGRNARHGESAVRRRRPVAVAGR